MEEILKMQEAVNQITTTTNNQPYEAFICTMCMLFDEYAKANSRNAPELTDTVNQLVSEVNAAFGAY